MNQSYRLVWSAVRGAWAVVSELAKSHAKSGAAMVVVAAATAAMPAQAVLVLDSTMDLNSTGAIGSVQAASGVGNDQLVEFAEGETFTFSSENFLLNAFDVGSKITEEGDGDGIYNFTKTDSTQTGFAGIQANGGGVIDLSNAKKINYTSAAKANFIDASGLAIFATNNSSIKLSDLTLSYINTGNASTSFDAPAIKAQSNSQISIAKLELTTNENGLTAQGAGSRIEIGGGLITANATSAQAATSFDQGEIVLINTDIEMSGDGAKAVVISDNGGRATITGGKINLQGANAKVFQVKDSNLSVTGASIIASGSNSDGLVLENLNSTTDAETQIALSDTTIDATRTALLFRGGVETVDVVGGSLTGVNAIAVSDASFSANLTVNTNDTILKGMLVLLYVHFLI